MTNAAGVAELYTAPLAEFTARRDAWVKQLRASGQREEAAAVKSLRKPSRSAWALNVAALHDRDAFERLTACVEATIEAHGGNGDVREAMTHLRDAVRAFAMRAATLAGERDISVDAPTLSQGILATLASDSAFAQLATATLTDVPEAGGLDFLASLPAPPPTLRVLDNAGAAQARRAPKHAEAENSAALERANAVLSALRAEAERVLRDLNDAETALDAAERQCVLARRGLEKAEQTAASAGKRRDEARARAAENAARIDETELIIRQLTAS